MKTPEELQRGVSREEMEEAVRVLLRGVGEDLSREGLQETPSRVARMYLELTSGLRELPPKMTTFDRGGNDQMVVVKDLTFHSLCEHHLLPFFGTVAVGYLPLERLLGLSKFGRVVDHFARRPQIQEQLTAQVADALFEALKPEGLIVLCTAEHLCMSVRGVRKPGHLTVTSAIRGSLDKEEFFELMKT